jgi:hypothetical protein
MVTTILKRPAPGNPRREGGKCGRKQIRPVETFWRFCLLLKDIRHVVVLLIMLTIYRKVVEYFLINIRG